MNKNVKVKSYDKNKSKKSFENRLFEVNSYQPIDEDIVNNFYGGDIEFLSKKDLDKVKKLKFYQKVSIDDGFHIIKRIR